MKLNGRIRRMNSMMIKSNIRFLSRMELIYPCISKLVVLALEDVSALETHTNIPAIQRCLEGNVDADNGSGYYCRLKDV